MSETQQSNVAVPIPVTETTPLLGDNIPRTETIVEVILEPVAENKESTNTSEPEVVLQVATESSEDFRSAVDVIQTTACANDSESEEQGSLIEDESVKISLWCCAIKICLFEWWCTVTAYILGSLLLLPIQLVLLLFPISAGLMGAMYMDKCPVSVATPVILFMMGIVGIVVVLCRIGIVLTRRFLPRYEYHMAETVVVVGTSILLILYCTELLCFSKIFAASSKSAANNFCNEFFYDYTYYANWTFLGVILAAAVFHLPSGMCNGSIGRTQNAET